MVFGILLSRDVGYSREFLITVRTPVQNPCSAFWAGLSVILGFVLGLGVHEVAVLAVRRGIAPGLVLVLEMGLVRL